VSSDRLTYRQQQAADTRARIARAARSVFAARGYSAATIADIAHAAGVAVPTLYKLYRNKAGLLTAVIDTWRGEFVPSDVDAIPGNPSEALAWWAATIRRQWDTGLDIATILTGAAASEPEVREELSGRLAGRDTWVRRLAETVEPGLADGITTNAAAAIISALALPDIYRELVIVHGWTSDAYQSWLEQGLVDQLLT